MFPATTFEQFVAMAASQPHVMVTLEMLGDRYTPVNVFEAMTKDAAQAILLDTSDYRKHSPADAGVFIALNPIANFLAYGDEITIISDSFGQKQFHQNAFAALRDFYHQFRCYTPQPLAKLAGGIVGVLTHDAIRLIETIPNRHPDEDHLPDLHFTCYGTHIIFDRRTGKILLAQYVVVEENKKVCYEKAMIALVELKQQIEQSNYFEIEKNTSNQNKQAQATPTPIIIDSDDDAFCKMVEKAKVYISRGDAFQIVPSRRFQRRFQGRDFNVYRALKALNPSPYLYYIRYPEYSIVGASPEKLVSLQNDVIQITPIAGSRPRGATPEADENMMLELLNDDKELAEHMMLIDLARNDVGKVSLPGTVKVIETKAINKFSHIMHLTSIVEGTLHPDCDVFDVLKAGFPAGTLTGAPKIRATEIIDEIEQSRRGIYGGAVCAIDNQGQMDSCILIRSAMIKNGVATVRAGAGVVLDSDPQKEAEETRHKAQGILSALELAEKTV